MALFFDLTSIQKEAKCNPNTILTIFDSLSNNLSLGSKFVGTNFLLNPKGLLTRKTNIDILYKIQYIVLASKRDYINYKLYNFAGLDLSLYPDLNRKAIASNPLLEIKNNILYFLYEERDKNGNFI